MSDAVDDSYRYNIVTDSSGKVLTSELYTPETRLQRIRTILNHMEEYKEALAGNRTKMYHGTSDTPVSVDEYIRVTGMTLEETIEICRNRLNGHIKRYVEEIK